MSNAKKPIQGNKAPLPETKKKPIGPHNIWADPLDIPNWLKEEGKREGVVFRWIDGKKYQGNFGFHSSGWQAYKPKATAEGFGKDTEGYVRRGDLILAFKTTEDVQAHREALAERARMYSGNFQSQKAQELRDLASDMGVRSRIEEGYEDRGEEVEDDE